MSRASNSARSHAALPLVVDVRTLQPVAVPLPPPVRAHDAGARPEFGGATAAVIPAQVQAAAAIPLPPREPTFDELVRGSARHRGAAAETPARRGFLARLGRRSRRGPAQRRA